MMNMPGIESGKEKRRFIRFPYEKGIRYKKLLLDGHKVSVMKSGIGISKNLSSFGILFRSKDLPALSDIILLNIDYAKNPECRKMKESILMLGGRPVGKVVRIEEKAAGQYEVAVAFIANPEHNANKIELLTRFSNWRRSAIYLSVFLCALFIIYATLSANIIYMEKRETYHPDKIMYTDPASIGIFYEDIDLKTEDGQIISGWFVPSKDAKETILFCPGSRGNLCDQLVRIKFFHDMGTNLMIFDYRGYGKNSGRPTEQGFYKDALAAYDYLIARNDIDKDRIVVVGESLGGAVAANLCLKRKARALVLESSVVSLGLAAQKLYPFLPVETLLSKKYDTLSKIKNINIPKLFVHGTDDESISFYDALKLYYSACPPKKFLPFQGAHNDDIYKVSDAYKEELIKFFKDNNI